MSEPQKLNSLNDLKVPYYPFCAVVLAEHFKVVETESMERVLPQAAVALVKHPNGRYLLVKRALDIPGAGYWCPVSGKPETTESLQEAAVREVKEEVGLSVRALDEIYRCATSDGSYDLVWFRCELSPPQTKHLELTLDSTEVSEAGWFSAEEALSLRPMFDATRKFFQELASHISP